MKKTNSTYAILIMFVALLTIVARTWADGPKSQPEQMVLLKAQLKMATASLKQKAKKIRTLEKQIDDLEQNVATLEALCEKHKIEFRTPAEQTKANKKTATEYDEIHEKYKMRYAVIKGKYVPLPELTTPQCYGYFVLKVGQRVRLTVAKVSRVLSDQEMLLGHMAVGNFGSGGFYWLKKTHPNIVITGYPTKNLADDQQVFQRGLGDLDVAIIGTIKIGSSTYLHAVPYAQIGKGLTKAQFSNMLRKGVGPREAVELIRQLDEIAIEHPKSVQTSDSKQPKGTGRASSTPTGKTVVWVDLLKLIDPNKHDVSADLHGTWSKSSQGLQTTGKAKRRPVSIEIPYRPGNEYDLQALFTRPADTTGFICPLGDKAFGLSFGPRSTWCRIGGHEKVQFTSKNGQLTALLLSVRRDSVRVVVDGKQILQHRIQDIKIETPGPPDWLRGNNLGIIVHSAKMTFQKIAIREVGKK